MADPFLQLYGLMGEASPVESPFLLGTVIEEYPNLKVSTNNIVLEKTDFLVSSNLITLNNAEINCVHDKCNITHSLKDKLNKNDKVLLIEIDSTYILLSKVISI